jgi:hypothetical protein
MGEIFSLQKVRRLRAFSDLPNAEELWRELSQVWHQGEAENE